MEAYRRRGDRREERLEKKELNVLVIKAKRIAGGVQE
jgi:hypothetical protein